MVLLISLTQYVHISWNSPLGGMQIKWFFKHLEKRFWGCYRFKWFCYSCCELFFVILIAMMTFKIQAQQTGLQSFFLKACMAITAELSDLCFKVFSLIFCLNKTHNRLANKRTCKLGLERILSACLHISAIQVKLRKQFVFIC